MILTDRGRHHQYTFIIVYGGHLGFYCIYDLDNII